MPVTLGTLKFVTGTNQWCVLCKPLSVVVCTVVAVMKMKAPLPSQPLVPSAESVDCCGEHGAVR